MEGGNNFRSLAWLSQYPQQLCVVVGTSCKLSAVEPEIPKREPADCLWWGSLHWFPLFFCMIYQNFPASSTRRCRTPLDPPLVLFTELSYPRISCFTAISSACNWCNLQNKKKIKKTTSLMKNYMTFSISNNNVNLVEN